MTFWAKLLTVIILVMSVFFAAASAILFAKKTEWRQAYDTVKKNADAQANEANTKLQQLEVVFEKTRDDRDQLRADKLALEKEKGACEDQIAQMKQQDKEKTLAFTAMNTQLVTVQEQYKVAEDRYNTVRNEKEKLVAEVSDLTTRLTESDKANHQLNEQKVALTDQLQKTKENLASATESLEAKKALIDHLYAVFPNMRQQIDSYAKLEPRINGKALIVDEASGIVIINVGKKAGVEKEFKFTAYRNGDYKGMIRIFALQGDDLAAGHIESLAKDAQGTPKKIEIGDDVSTAIGY